MTKKSTIRSFLVIVIIAVNVIVIHGNQGDEEYVDSVVNSLLNGDSIEFANYDADLEDENLEQPIYEDGIWKCGNCDVINENSLIYTEVYNIETNYLKDVLYEVQVGVSVEGMQCMTVTSRALSRAVTRPRVVRGACARSRVTLAVQSAQEFTVRVYGQSINLQK